VPVRVAAAAALAAAMAGCGGGSTAGDGPADGDGEQTARLILEQRRAADSRLPVEGAFGFFELRRDGPQAVTSGSVPTTDEATLFDGRVPAGDYTIVSYQRPCSGNCRQLDMPTDQCEGDVSLDPGEQVTVMVTVHHGEGCTIRPR
jgi:hypothetical protein